MTVGAIQRPVRVLYVIGSLQTGGAERHLAQVLPRLDRNRWMPRVYCASERGELADALEAQDIPVIGPPVSRSGDRRMLPLRVVLLGLSWLKLFILLLRWRPTVVHFFLPEAYIVGAPAAILARTPVRLMSRRSLSHYQQRRRGVAWIEARLHPHMTAIVANSRGVLEDVAREPGVRCTRLELIYNGIDVASLMALRPRDVVRTELGIAADARVVIIVANLIPYKAHDLLLEALGGAKRGLPVDWRLMVVGRATDAGYAARLRELAARLDIADRILWLGQRRDVADLLGAADVGVLCSDEEGFSNAVLEAMAAGLPLVVTDVGGNREAVVDGATGFIVPRRDVVALRAALVRLLCDAELARRLGATGRERVSREFSLGTCVAGYDRLYVRALAAS